MPNPTTVVALVAALPIGALLVAGIVAWARRGNAIVDEPRLTLVADDPTPDDLTAPDDALAVDPPTTRLYVVPDPANMLPGLIQVGTAMVHRGCVADRRDGRTVRNCCAPLLARSATEVPW